jgi:membrane-anchored protein YejM (alkaline phosphatase superfamily)
MRSRLDRREFLKLLSSLSLVSLLGKECAAGETTNFPQGQGTPNVFILVFDTLSARHLSVYGYCRETMPNLARFAERAMVYHAHYAAGNFTAPGTASLLTGVYPWTHRALHHAGIVAKGHERQNLFGLFGDVYNRIAYPHNLWAHLLLNQFRKDVDIYMDPAEFSLANHTLYGPFSNDTDIAFRSFEDILFRDTSFPASLFLSMADEIREIVYERVELKEYADLYPRGVPTLGTYEVFYLLEHVMDGIMALISKARQPLLAYLHLFPPHEPYCPSREFVGIFDDGWKAVAKEARFFPGKLSEETLNQKRMQYDEYIAYADAEFGRLYDFMAETGLLDSSYVVFTSDHGELFERGVHGHDTTLVYEPVIHIPLLLSCPGQQQREDVYTLTNCVDLLPTLLHVTGRSVPDWCEGEVLPMLGSKEDSGERDDERSVFSVEAKSNPIHSPLVIGTVALIRGQYKLIHYFGYSGYESEYELYDLVNDPDELEDLCLSKRSIAAELKSELEEKLVEANQPYVS